ncbi:hypothetical protein [Neptunomonas sp.]|uniref:hypothetical protein n=1 Tax=Neptunomonas sp. TaxID=1971898 RepID=UPI00356A2A17
MPIKNAVRTLPASKYYKNISYETLAASWFANDCWEVFMPLVDHGSKTDLLIADDSNTYRIQVKALALNDESQTVQNQWGDVNIDYVIFFSHTGNWGYITPPFREKSKKLNADGHIRFHQHEKNFAKAFQRI